MEHTPGEWTYSVFKDGQPATLFSEYEGEEIDIAMFEPWGEDNGEQLANAKRIVNEHNTYPKLVAALEKIAKNEEDVRKTMAVLHDDNDETKQNWLKMVTQTERIAKQALEAAKEVGS